MLFFVSCSKNEVINNVEKDVHDQLSTNVEICLLYTSDAADE